MRDTVRLNFEFPRKYYPYLKMVLAKRGISLKDFASRILIEAIESAEDELSTQRGNERLDKMNDEDLIPWEDAKHLAGWDDGEIRNTIR